MAPAVAVDDASDNKTNDSEIEGRLDDGLLPGGDVDGGRIVGGDRGITSVAGPPAPDRQRAQSPKPFQASDQHHRGVCMASRVGDRKDGMDSADDAVTSSLASGGLVCTTNMSRPPLSGASPLEPATSMAPDPSSSWPNTTPQAGVAKEQKPPSPGLSHETPPEPGSEPEPAFATNHLPKSMGASDGRPPRTSPEELEKFSLYRQTLDSGVRLLRRRVRDGPRQRRRLWEAEDKTDQPQLQDGGGSPSWEAAPRPFLPGDAQLSSASSWAAAKTSLLPLMFRQRSRRRTRLREAASPEDWVWCDEVEMCGREFAVLGRDRDGRRIVKI